MQPLRQSFCTVRGRYAVEFDDLLDKVLGARTGRWLRFRASHFDRQGSKDGPARIQNPINSRRTKCRSVRVPHANAAPAKADDPDTRAANADALLPVCWLQRL
jgi:hypothetical protein